MASTESMITSEPMLLVYLQAFEPWHCGSTLIPSRIIQVFSGMEDMNVVYHGLWLSIIAAHIRLASRCKVTAPTTR